MTVVTERDDRGGMDVVFEFVNLNTFLSVDLLREWFECIICEYRLFTKNPIGQLIEFKFGSYHFIDSPKERQQSPFTVTASFCDLDMNPQTVLNPKICAFPVSIKCAPTDLVIPRCNENTVKCLLCFHSEDIEIVFGHRSWTEIHRLSRSGTVWTFGIDEQTPSPLRSESASR